MSAIGEGPGNGGVMPQGGMPQGVMPQGVMPQGVMAGAVLRPPALTWNGMAYTGPIMAGLDVVAAERLPGVLRVVTLGNFVGVVALTPVHAQDALARLAPQWQPRPMLLAGEGAVLRAVSRTYSWPVPSDADATWALAWVREGRVDVWTATPAPAGLALELADLLALTVDVVRVHGNGKLSDDVKGGSNDGDDFQRDGMRHDGLRSDGIRGDSVRGNVMRDQGTQRGLGVWDAAADAALLSQAVGRPVRVVCAGGGPAASTQIAVGATLHPVGPSRHVTVDTDRVPWRRPSLARLLSHESPVVRVGLAIDMPYQVDGIAIFSPGRIDVPIPEMSTDDIVHANVFAAESFIDELARDQGESPVDFRLARIDHPRSVRVIRDVARRAQWGANLDASDDVRRGRGFAFVSRPDAAGEPAQSVSAWVVDVAVDPDGGVSVTRVVAGQESATMSAPPLKGTPVHASDRTQIGTQLETRVRQAAQRMIQTPPTFDTDTSLPDEAAHLPIVPMAVDVTQSGPASASPGDLGWTPAIDAPAAAAIANAIFDATGVRLRSPPFQTPGNRRLLATRPENKARAWTAVLAGGLGLAAAGLLAASPWRSAIPPAVFDPGLYSEQAIERGRRVAAAGDCVVCHTAPGGVPNVGGLALDTPFGTIYSTNITPDRDTGIGAWSLPAFERAMREGIHRDGRHLYPAFPYTSFAKMSDGDIQSLYAYLMTREPVAHTPPATALAFPYNVRGVMAGWNTLFLDRGVYQPDPTQSLAWNRGAYLVQGAGHCGACHTPRNPLGAEKRGMADFLAGGTAEGWEAPALNGRSRSPLPWTETDFFQYLRTGYSARHGVAAGPMAPVVQSMAALPDADIAAMSTYLVSLQAEPDVKREVLTVTQLEQRGNDRADLLHGLGARLYQGACAVCHDPGQGPASQAARPSLALATSLHSDSPDNLLQVILQGIQSPAHPDLGVMPGYADVLDDVQIEALALYLQQRHTDSAAPWTGVRDRARELRAGHAPAR